MHVHDDYYWSSETPSASDMLIDLFHIVSAHAYKGHVARYLSIIGETLQRWGKRILSHCYFLCNQ